MATKHGDKISSIKKLEYELLEVLSFGTAFRILHGKKWKGHMARMRIYYCLTRPSASITFDPLYRFSTLSKSSFSGLIGDLWGSDRVSKEAGYYQILDEGKKEYEVLLESLKPALSSYVIDKYLKEFPPQFAKELKKYKKFDKENYERVIGKFNRLIDYVKNLAMSEEVTEEELLMDVEKILQNKLREFKGQR